MSNAQKILATAFFTLILLTLGTADYVLTQGTLKLPPREGIAKKAEPDVATVAESQVFTVTETTERQLLEERAVKGKRTVWGRVLLKENDRAATIAWIDAPDVKEIFTALRKDLRPKFSSDFHDLIDETQSQPGKPPRDVLSFRDPRVHPERLLFVRVRERLYELHVKEGHEKDIDGLIDALTE